LFSFAAEAKPGQTIVIPHYYIGALEKTSSLEKTNIMTKSKIGGAILIFVSAFSATSQIFSEGDWNTNDTVIIVCCAVLFGIGIYAVTKPEKRS